MLLSTPHPRMQYFVLLLAVSPVIQVVISISPAGNKDYFGLFVDAGSSSSKLKLYKWSPPKSVSSMPEITLIDSTKINTPIKDFYDDWEGLDDYIDNMLEWGATRIPESKHRTAPILLQATAGMRYLTGEMTKTLMTKVREILSNSSRNPFAPILHNDVSVISGEEEGVYAWIAANYLLGFFEGNKTVSQSVGVMEMGGGSTQITFIPEGPNYAGEFQVRLANRRYSLYVHSYLNLGASAIDREILHQLQLGMEEIPDHLEDPCMLKGDNKTVSLGQESSTNVVGDGNATRCGDILYEILKPAEGIECQPKPCAIRQVYQPAIGNGTFYATSAFTYAPATLNAVRKDGTLDLEQMLAGADDLCNTTFEDAIDMFPGREKYISSDCRMGNYIPRLLQNYGFDLKTRNIIVTSKIKSQNIDWALGAMMMKLSDRFASSRGTFSILCPTKSGPIDNGGSTSHLTGLHRTPIITMAMAIPLILRFLNIIPV